MTRWHLALLGLLLLTAGVYGHGLWTAGFVWDDVPLILMNDALGRLDRVPSLFAEDLWSTSGAGEVHSGYYRPLVLLSFSLDKAMFGDQPLGYHLHSLAWHLLAVVALVAVLKDLVGEGAGLAGATVFALHPVQSECVAWISARNDLMAAALCLGCIAVLQGRGRSRLRWWLGVTLACAAVLSKESALLLPLLVAVLDWCRPRADRAPGGMAAVMLGIGLAIGLRLLAGVGGATLPPMEGWALVGVHAVDWVGTLGASVIWPAPVTSARDLHWADLVPAGRVAIGWGGLGLMLIVGLLHRGRSRRLAMGGLLWVCASMALIVVPMADKGGFGDRFWYLPLVGVALFVAAVIPRRVAPWWSMLVAVSAVVVLSVRLQDWRDDAQMWAAAARDVPIPVNHVGLAHAMSMDGRLKRAHVAFVGALTTDRLANDACPRIVGSAVRMGHPAHGVRMGLWAMERGCAPTGTLTGWLATAQVLSGEWEAARQTLRLGTADPTPRTDVVRAAIAQRDGDAAAHARAVDGREEIAERAAQLFDGAAKAEAME
jgi:hypothetical protein